MRSMVEGAPSLGCLTAGPPPPRRSASRSPSPSREDLKPLPRRFHGRRVGGQLADHRLGFEELLEPELAELAAIAGLLVAAEGRVEIEPAGIDVDAAGADFTDDRLR